MARVTIEDCLENVENMYELVHLATKRTRQLVRGSEPLIKSKNRFIVTALREIAAGKVKAHRYNKNINSNAGSNEGLKKALEDDPIDELLPVSS